MGALAGIAWRLVTGRGGLIVILVIAVPLAAFIAVKWHGRQIGRVEDEAFKAGELVERAIWAGLVTDYKAARDAERQRAAVAIADLGNRAAKAETQIGGLINANEQLLAEIAGRVDFVDWTFDPDIVRALNRLEYPAASAGLAP